MGFKTKNQLITDMGLGYAVRNFIDSVYTGVVSVQAFGAKGDGVTDDTAAIQGAMDANPNGIVIMPPGSYLISDVLVKPAGCSFKGSGVTTVLLAATGFPTTHTAYSKTFDAPVLYCDNTEGTKISRSGRFMVDGDSIARTGIVFSNGAGHEYGNIRVQNTTVQAYVMDGCQNYLFRKMWTNIVGDTSYYIVNGTYNCSFVGCDGSRCDVVDLKCDNDANYPAFGVFSVEGMSECTWTGGILERVTTLVKERVVLITEGSYNTFLGTQFTGTGTTIATVECGSNSNHNVFINTRLIGDSVEKPAIVDRGFENVFLYPSISLYGSSTLVDLIEVYNISNIIKPLFAGITVSGKHIVNKAGASSLNVRYEPLVNAGATGSRPTISIDANYHFWDATLDKLITWDFAGSRWVNQDGILPDQQTYADGDTTPSVLATLDMDIANTGATTITNFDDEVIGQRWLLNFKDGNTTIQSGSNVRLAGGVNFVASADDTLELYKQRTSPFAIIEVGRSVNEP